MTDHLIEKYNLRQCEIQDEEARALAGALEVYTQATSDITLTAAMRRVEAATELAAAMAQRDHDYIHGRKPPPEEEKKQEDEGEAKPPAGATGEGEKLSKPKTGHDLPVGVPTLPSPEEEGEDEHEEEAPTLLSPPDRRES